MISKEKIYSKCKEMCSERLANAERELSELSHSSNQDTKSSAGDKYETGRAMIALEKEKIAHQIMDAQRMLMVLSQIKPEQIHTKVDLGSLVETKAGHFFISISLGKLEIDEHQCFVISPVSPIGKALSGLETGGSFTFNGRPQSIINLS